MKISDIMNPSPTTINRRARLCDAAALVSRTQVSDLMVIDDNGAFVGVLSEGDLIRAALPDYDELIQGDVPLHQVWRVFLEKGRELANRPITPLIISSPIVLNPSDELLKAAASMINRQIRILPVVTQGHLAGTISRGDLSNAILTQ
ncbi:MAG: CBS domain-containing protein [Deltaproteobacteria bacterium]|nr:CBS domain-containing protein [Deltaproteobacteria bacterium]